MKNKISGIIAILIFFFLSKSCISDYMEPGRNVGDMSVYKRLVDENTYTEALLDSMYTKRTTKIMGVASTLYDVTYHFEVAGTTYHGSHTFNDVLPKIPVVKVYYLKSYPDTNCVDPQEKLDATDRTREQNGSKSTLYWGIAFGFLCLISVVGFVQDLRKKEEKKEDEPANNFMGY